jgi:hypothetical protein
MMVNVMVIRYMSPRHSVLLIIRHQGSKSPNRVDGPLHRGKRASGSTAGVAGDRLAGVRKRWAETSGQIRSETRSERRTD